MFQKSLHQTRTEFIWELMILITQQKRLQSMYRLMRLSANPDVKSFSIEKRNTAGQNMPAIRPAIHSDGTVYATVYGNRTRTPINNTDSNYTADVVVVRDDEWAMSPNPFSSLLDPADNNVGRQVVSNVTVCWRNRSYLGEERIGGDLAITVDPKNSSKLYLAWTDKQPNSDSSLHIRGSTNRGLRGQMIFYLCLTPRMRVWPLIMMEDLEYYISN